MQAALADAVARKAKAELQETEACNKADMLQGRFQQLVADVDGLTEVKQKLLGDVLEVRVDCSSALLYD